MRGAATKSMSDIVEERQQSRYAPFAAAPFAAAPLRAAAHTAAGRSSRWLCCSLLTYRPGIARRSRLASGPGRPAQNVKLFLREPLDQNPTEDTDLEAFYPCVSRIPFGSSRRSSRVSPGRELN